MNMLTQQPKRTIFVADDEQEITQLLTKRLTQAGYEVHSANDGKEALRKIRELMPDLILLDIMMPEAGGFDVKRELNKSEATAEIPAIFLSAKTSEEDKVKGFDLHADDYVTKPFGYRELKARIDSILSRREKHEERLMTDPMTGLYNQSVYKNKAKWLFDIAKRYKRDFTLVVLDIDNLKKVNDHLGHIAGDEMIKITANAMKKVFRTSDILVRYGGDEFVVIMPETAESQAAIPIRRLRAEIQNAQSKTLQNPFSVSVGAASYKEGMIDETDLFNLADQRMYAEKEFKKQNESD